MSDVNPPVLPGAEPFETNKTLSIIAIVVGAVTCGCLTLIFGILGVVFANKAQTLWNAGDMTGAASAASSARIFAIIGFVLAAIWVVFAIFGTAAGFLSVPFAS